MLARIATGGDTLKIENWIRRTATALVFWAFGAWALAAPANAAAALGLGFSTADGPTAIRAIYGGYLLGALLHQ